MIKLAGSTYYKKYVDNLIKSFPSDIVIMRNSLIDDGYGGYTEENTSINEQVILYDRKIGLEFIEDAGKGFRGVSVTKLLARGDADIKRNDIFTLNDLEYRVLFVKNYFDICNQIEIEVIK